MNIATEDAIRAMQDKRKAITYNLISQYAGSPYDDEADDLDLDTALPPFISDRTIQQGIRGVLHSDDLDRDAVDWSAVVRAYRETLA